MAESTARPSRFFSDNPDKAWAERFFLLYIPVWFAFNMAVHAMGWLDTGNFWNITQNLLMWIPWCVLLAAWLRRDSGIPWHQSYWFKFNVFIVVPQLLVATVMGTIMKLLFPGEPIWTMAFAAASLAIAALAMLRVRAATV